jgi:Flp pilus assembly protein TadD
VVSAQSLDVLWYVLAVVIVVATLWRFAPRKQEALFWMLWAAIGVLPFLQIFKPLPSTVREHWLYLPLVGLLAVYAEIVGGLLQNEATKKKTLVGVALVAVAFMGFTVMRNHDWRDARKLYAHDVAMEPKSFLLWNNVGVEAFRRGAMQDAADAFSRAISAGAGARYAMAYNNLGYVYQLSKMPQQAEAMFVKSLQLSPSERAFLNLCGLYIDAGQVEAAEKVLIQGAQSLPQSKSIAENLARVRAYQAQRKAK